MALKVEIVEPITTHPVQNPHARYGSCRINTAVTLRAYEVYCHLFHEQPALVEGECRGGFGCGELMAFLYARSFPKVEWHDRFEEALHGMLNL